MSYLYFSDPDDHDTDSDTGSTTSDDSYSSYEADPLSGRKLKSSNIERKTQLKTDGRLLSLDFHGSTGFVEGDLLKRLDVFAKNSNVGIQAIDTLSTKIVNEIRHNSYRRYATQNDKLLLSTVAIFKIVVQQTRQALHDYQEELDKVKKRQLLINFRAVRNLTNLLKYMGDLNDVHLTNWTSAEFAIRNTVGDIRLMVVLALAELLPSSEFISRERREYYTRFINGTGWSKFLDRVTVFYHSHYVFYPVGLKGDGRWIHQNSIFSCFQNKFFESSYLNDASTRHGRGMIRLPTAIQNSTTNDNYSHPHAMEFSLPVFTSGLDSSTSTVQRTASGRDPNDSPVVIGGPVQALRFFVPLLIWSYNACKECLVLLDALIAQVHQEVSIPDSLAGSASADRTPKMKVEVDYSAVFLHGSAVDVRHRLARSGDLVKLVSVIDAVEKEDAVQDTTKPSIKLYTVGEVGKMEDAVHRQKFEDELRKERQTFLNKFNLIKKCLLILTDDLFMHVILHLNVRPTVQERAGVVASNPLVKVLEGDLRGLVQKLHQSDDDYDFNRENLFSTEREMDSFVSTAVGSESIFCEDYKILLALLENLNPLGDDSSNISSGPIRDGSN